MANNGGKATKGGAAAPGVNVNGCQCQSVKFLMASDIGRRAKVPHQSADVCTLFVRQTQTNTQHKFQPHTRVVSAPRPVFLLTRLSRYGRTAGSPPNPRSQVSSPHYRKSKCREDVNFAESLRHH